MANAWLFLVAAELTGRTGVMLLADVPLAGLSKLSDWALSGAATSSPAPPAARRC